MAMAFAKCPHCSTTLQVESTIEAAACPVCGNAFAVDKAIQNYNGGAPAQPEKKEKKPNVWAIVAVVLAVLLLTTGGILLWQNITNNNNNDNDSKSSNKSNPDALTGRYVSESGLYEIEFEDDFTCRWYQNVHGNDSYFVGTYEKDGDVYILRMEGGNYSYNTEFTAEPVEDGLIITGGLVDGELFTKE